MSALRAQTPLQKVSRETEESTAKLSSGQRITKAADDASGLAISEKLKAEIRSSKQANRNANDGISLVQTAEGGLNETSSILTRMRELAIQSASDTLGDSDRAKTSIEYQNLKDELERISQTTEFNGTKLLNGKGPNLDFQIGVGSNNTEDQISYNTGQLNSGINSLGVSSASISTKQGAQESLGKIDSAINKVSGQRSVLGSLQNRLVSSSNNLMIYSENMSSANSRIRDVDYAEETAKQAKNSILSSSGTAVLSQANMSGQGALKLLS
ncbi:MAG: flagellin FliC [Bacteriovoracaceae bacterium]|nr:flagellin FliC [Bacteriovoracaceae bacterium]